MKSFSQFLIEAPLDELEYSSVRNRPKDPRNKKGEKISSFSTTDDKLIRNPKNQEKLFKALKSFRHSFRILFADFQGSANYHENGELSEYVLKRPENKKIVDFLKVHGFINNDFKFTEKTKKSITIVYTTNRGDAKVGLTPWLILHRMGHAFNAGSLTRDKFAEKFVNEVRRDIYDFMESNYLLDEDAYGEMSDSRFQDLDARRREILKNIARDKFPNEGLWEFFTKFGNFNSAKRTEAHAQGKGKRTKAVVRKERYFEYIYDLFVAFVWYAENSRNVWEEDDEPGTLPYRFVGKLPEKINFMGLKLALTDEFVAEQAEGYMKNMISNGVRNVEKMFDEFEGKIFLM
jgi:hypothetical protein